MPNVSKKLTFEDIVDSNRMRQEMASLRKHVDEMKKSMAAPVAVRFSGSEMIRGMGAVGREQHKLIASSERMKAMWQSLGMAADSAGQSFQKSSQAMSKINQFQGTKFGAANVTRDANQARFAIFQLTSGFQDAVIALQMMGNTVEGWSMAMRGASNNIGVMLSTMGTWTAIGGTIALAILPQMISGLMRMFDTTTKNKQALDQYIQSLRTFAGLEKLELQTKQAPERRQLRLRAGKELIERGAVSDETMKRLTDINLAEEAIPHKRIVEGIEAKIAKEQKRLTEQQRQRIERIDPQTGLPVYGDAERERLMKEAISGGYRVGPAGAKIYVPGVREQAKESILTGDVAKEYEKAQAAIMESEAKAKRQAEKDAKQGADFWEGLKSRRARAAAETATGLVAPRVTKNKKRLLDEAEALNELGFAKGGIVPGSGGTDSKLIKATPGEEVLTKDDPRHITNIVGYARGGIVTDRMLKQREINKAATRAAIEQREKDKAIRFEVPLTEYLGHPTEYAGPTAAGVAGLANAPRGYISGPSGTVTGADIAGKQGHDVMPGGGYISGPGGTIARNPIGGSGGMIGAQPGGYISGAGGTFGTHYGRSHRESPHGVVPGGGYISGPSGTIARNPDGSIIGESESRVPAIPRPSTPTSSTTGSMWKREENWPYTGRPEGPSDWQTQLKQRYQRREASVLGRIPSSARIGDVPPSAGIASSSGEYIGSGIQGGFKRAPWERGPGVPDVVGPGAGSRSRRPLSAPGMAFHEGRAVEQGIYSKAQEDALASRKKLEEDLARYHEEAWQKKMRQMQEELRIYREMHAIGSETHFNRNAQL